MNALGADKVTRAALMMIALGIWSLFLLQIRAAVQPREIPAVPSDTAKAAPRYQLHNQGDSKMYLVDTYTGRTWGALGSSSLSSGEFMEVTPAEICAAKP